MTFKYIFHFPSLNIRINKILDKKSESGKVSAMPEVIYLSEEIEIKKENYPNIEKYLKNLAKQKKRFYNRLIEIDKQLAEWRKIYEKINKE